MNTTVRITLPDPPPTSVRAVYDDVQDAFGPDVEIVLEVRRPKAISDLAPWVGILAPLAYIGKIVVDKAVEKAVDRTVEAMAEKGPVAFRRLISRLREGESGPPRGVEVVDSVDADEDGHGVVFLFDDLAATDERAVPEMLRVRSEFTPPVRLRWDPETGSWRRSEPPS